MDDPKTNQSTPDSFRRYCRNDFHWQTGFCIRHNLHDLRCCNRDRCCGQLLRTDRRDASNRRKQKAGPLFSFDSKSSHHIIDNDGFSPYKYDHAYKSGNEPQQIHGLQYPRNLSKIFPVEDSINCTGEYKDQKYHIKRHLFLIFHDFIVLIFCLYRQISFHSVSDMSSSHSSGC